MGYPSHDHIRIRNGLRNLQESLGLDTEDVKQTERHILALKHQQMLEVEELKRKQEQEKIKQEQEDIGYDRQSYEQEFSRPAAGRISKAFRPLLDRIRYSGINFLKHSELEGEAISGYESSILQIQDVDQNNQQDEKIPQLQESVQDDKTDISSKN
jgi:hypothetical protein